MTANNDETRYTTKEAVALAIDALTKLAKLGNGDQFGNSEGNIIAQQALSAISEAPVQPDGDALRKAVNLIQQKADDFANENGTIDPDTGALEFGSGEHAEIKECIHSLMCELADDIAALSQSAQPSDKTEEDDDFEDDAAICLGNLAGLLFKGGAPSDWIGKRVKVISNALEESSQAVAPAQAMPEQQQKDHAFLMEIQGRVKKGRSGDTTQLDYVEQMIQDWIDELSAAPQPNQEQSGTDTQARDDE